MSRRSPTSVSSVGRIVAFTVLSSLVACSYEGTRADPPPFSSPPATRLAGCPKADSSTIVGTGQILDVALRGDDVFWLDGNAVRMWRAGETKTLARVDGVPLRLIADEEFVFVSHPGGATTVDGQARDASIARVSIATGEVKELLPSYPGAKPRSADLAFWRDRVVFTTYDGTLRSLPRDASTPAQIMWASQYYPKGYDVALRSLEIGGDIALHRANALEPPAEAIWVDLVRMVDPGVSAGRVDYEDRLQASALVGPRTGFVWSSAITGKLWWQAKVDTPSPPPATPLLPPVFPRELRMEHGLLHLLDAQRVHTTSLEAPALAAIACGRALSDLVTAPGYVAWIESGTEVRRLATPATVRTEPPPEKPVELAMPADAAPRTVHVRAYLDSAAHLFIAENKMWWVNTLERPPGFADDGVLRPSEIDGVSWAPAFAFVGDEALPGLGRFENNCNCSSQPLELPWSLPRAPQIVAVELTKGRARVQAFVAQQPSAVNDYTMIVTLQEEGVLGQAWVEVELRLLATPLSADDRRPLLLAVGCVRRRGGARDARSVRADRVCLRPARPAPRRHLQRGRARGAGDGPRAPARRRNHPRRGRSPDAGAHRRAM